MEGSMVSPWLALVGYAVLVYVAAPRAEGHRAFLWARAKNGARPSTEVSSYFEPVRVVEEP